LKCCVQNQTHLTFQNETKKEKNLSPPFSYLACAHHSPLPILDQTVHLEKAGLMHLPLEKQPVQYVGQIKLKVSVQKQLEKTAAITINFNLKYCWLSHSHNSHASLVFCFIKNKKNHFLAILLIK